MVVYYNCVVVIWVIFERVFVMYLMQMQGIIVCVLLLLMSFYSFYCVKEMILLCFGLVCCFQDCQMVIDGVCVWCVGCKFMRLVLCLKYGQKLFMRKCLILFFWFCQKILLLNKDVVYGVLDLVCYFLFNDYGYLIIMVV